MVSVNRPIASTMELQFYLWEVPGTQLIGDGILLAKLETHQLKRSLGEAWSAFDW